MNQLLGVAIEIRLAGLFLVGLLLGSLINLGVYQLAWNDRAISPWSAGPKGGPQRRWSDRVPVVGWLGLRREASLHGWGFWIRPMLVELAAGAGLAALYWWEVAQGGIVPPQALAAFGAEALGVTHGRFLCHVVLLGLMLAGTLIDCDEKTIPDTITVPGTLFALLAAAVFPWSALPDGVQVNLFGRPPPPPVRARADGRILFAVNPPPPPSEVLHLTSPDVWPNKLDGFPQTRPLVIALGCWWLWCVGLMHRTWYSRHGVIRALTLMFARLRRDPSTPIILAVGAAGSIAIGAVWYFGGPGWESWRGLLSALVGLAVGGGIVWVVRILAKAVLNKEAMGFGDVTLMAMIGAFMGWQCGLLIFFLAPFAALIFGLVNLIFRRDREIPYGPFLCLAAAFVLLRWAEVWPWAANRIFLLGPIVPIMLAGCLAAMVPLLMLMRLITGRR